MFFNPLSNFYSQNLDSWMQTSGGIVNISKRYFYELFCSLGSVHSLKRIYGVVGRRLAYFLLILIQYSTSLLFLSLDLPQTHHPRQQYQPMIGKGLTRL